MEREWYEEFLTFMDRVEERGVEILYPMYYYSDVRQSAWFSDNPDQPFQFFRSRQAFSNHSRPVPEEVLNKLEEGERLEKEDLEQIITEEDGYKINPLVLVGFLAGFFVTFTNTLLIWQAKKYNKRAMKVQKERIRDLAENFVSKRYPQMEDIRRRRSERLYTKSKRGGIGLDILRKEAITQSATMSRLASNNIANKLLLMHIKHL